MLPSHVLTLNELDFGGLGKVPPQTQLPVTGEYGPNAECWRCTWSGQAVIVMKSCCTPQDSGQNAP